MLITESCMLQWRGLILIMHAHNNPSSKEFTACISHSSDGFLGWHSHQRFTNGSSVSSLGVGGSLSIVESTGTMGSSSVVTAAERENRFAILEHAWSQWLV